MSELRDWPHRGEIPLELEETDSKQGEIKRSISNLHESFHSLSKPTHIGGQSFLPQTLGYYIYLLAAILAKLCDLVDFAHT